jgi:hypothetical protein
MSSVTVNPKSKIQVVDEVFQPKCFAASAAATYSASVDDRTTTLWRFEDHETGPPVM